MSTLHDLTRLSPPVGCDGAVALSVSNASIEEALVSIAARVGWHRVTERAPGTVLITDRIVARTATAPPGNDAVLVCEPTPFGARCALDALAELVVASVVCADQPDDLESSLAGISSGRAVVPTRLLRLAALMPSLTERQLEVLQAVAAGQTNSQIAAGLYISRASVKRDMAALYAAVEAETRPALVARAAALGVPPVRAVP